VRDAFVSSVGWCGFFTLINAINEFHIDLLHFDHELDLAKVKDSAGVMGLKWLELAFNPDKTKGLPLGEIKQRFFSVVDQVRTRRPRRKRAEPRAGGGASEASKKKEDAPERSEQEEGGCARAKRARRRRISTKEASK
jgi:hypothetical protein